MNLGQWAPILASVFAAVGSLYMLLAENVDAANGGPRSGTATTTHHCGCAHHHHYHHHHHHHGDGSADGDESRGRDEMAERRAPVIRSSGERRSLSATDSRSLSPPGRAISQRATAGSSMAATTPAADAGGRRRVAGALTWLTKALGTASPDRLDDSGFKNGPAGNYPEIPAEWQRNSELIQIHQRYNTPTPDRRSRAGSFTGSAASGTGSRPLLELSLQHATTASGPAGGGDRLEVPSPVHPGGGRNSSPHPHPPSPMSVPASVAVPPSPSSPAILVSPHQREL